MEMEGETGDALQNDICLLILVVTEAHENDITLHQAAATQVGTFY